MAKTLIDVHVRIRRTWLLPVIAWTCRVVAPVSDRAAACIATVLTRQLRFQTSFDGKRWSAPRRMTVDVSIHRDDDGQGGHPILATAGD